MGNDTFYNTAIYAALNIGEDDTFVVNQALEFFRNRLVKQPKNNPWVEVPGQFGDPVEVECAKEGNHLKLVRIATGRALDSRGGACINIGENQFWFAQCACGTIYYARKS